MNTKILAAAIALVSVTTYLNASEGIPYTEESSRTAACPALAAQPERESSESGHDERQALCDSLLVQKLAETLIEADEKMHELKAWLNVPSLGELTLTSDMLRNTDSYSSADNLAAYTRQFSKILEELEALLRRQTEETEKPQSALRGNK